MMPLQCVTCQHFIIPDPRDEKFVCKAFPEGIPTEILTSEQDHDHVVEGQVGDYVWKKRVSRGGR